jgi:23S rRNA (uracil1939-C5)-methyltransferase
MAKVIIMEKTVEKNKIYQMNITGMGYKGEGVGKINNFTVFVEGAIEGENIKVKIVKVNKNYAFGKLMKIIEPSKKRTEPLCSTYKRCGGCSLQHMSYDAQLEFKRKRVEDAVSRIGKIDVAINPVIGMDNPYKYRNKVQLPVRLKKDEIEIGFYAERSHEIIGIDECLIQDEVSNRAAAVTKEWMKKYSISSYDETTSTGTVRHLVIRKGFKTGEVMIVIVTSTENLPYKNEFIDMMVKNIPGLKSIIQNVNSNNTNVILGEKCVTLWGEDSISDYIGEFKFNISPLSFFQVNPVQTEVLYSKALEFAKLAGNEIVFDAYCGTGTISLFLSQKAKKVYGVEIVHEAVIDAIQNAKNNNVNNVEFIEGKSEEVIPDLIKKGIHADVVVVDPPRKGCDAALINAIAAMRPKRIVYVSCDPGTLARDLAIFNDSGFIAREIQPVDMFPQTFHVETVVLMSRVEGK